MLRIDLSYISIFIVFAHLSESKVVILRDYDDEPLFIDHDGRSSHEEVGHVKHYNHGYSYKPKRTRNSKQAVIHYGRHIYHLDSFEDLTKLRSEMSQLNPDYISYDYVDLSDLIRSTNSKNAPADVLEDLIIFSATPIHIRCKGEKCDEDLRKFGKIKDDTDDDWKYLKMPNELSKRFKVVDNRKKDMGHKSRKPKPKYPEDVFSDEYQEKKPKQRFKKKKKTSHNSSSESKESRESSSAEKSDESWEVKKKYYESNSRSSEESKEYKKKRPKKKYDSGSRESTKNDIDQLKSIEDILNKKKKKKKRHNRHDLEETTRKTKTDDMFLQGNKIYHADGGKNKKKKDEEDRRRRLQQFLPKRYHWDPADIHDLGYFWFNGPKGQYPDPKSLLYKRK